MALSLTITLSFCVICGTVLLDIRRSDMQRATQAGQNVLATIEADIARNIELYALSLQGVVDGLRQSWIYEVPRETRETLLFDRAATAKHLGSIYVVDALGNVVIDSRSTILSMENFSERDFFRVHRHTDEVGLYISKPFIESDGEYVVGVSRRLSKSDGSFGGIVLGTLRLAYFEEMFRKVALGPNSTMTLTRTDGIVIMRWPYSREYIGRDLSRAEVYKLYPAARSGQFITPAVTDRVNRMFVYSQIGGLPLLMAIGQSTADIYAGWEREAASIGLIMIALCIVTVALALLLRRELRRRMIAEQQLAVLATTDSLTGLPNRRHFNDVIKREWQRSMREKTPLAVLMIDADEFKAYNDSHGHQAGDEVLQAIGQCIGISIRRASDLAARYGGEEFAVLLPGTSLEGAVEIAEKIRRNVSELRVRDHEGTRAMSTVSIGVAGLVPASGAHYRDLVAAADLALYEAKRRGRNRVEKAPTLVEASPAMAPDFEQPQSRVA
jgi:diguanylate cyclase (GGDEF)-like protein